MYHVWHNRLQRYPERYSQVFSILLKGVYIRERHVHQLDTRHDYFFQIQSPENHIDTENERHSAQDRTQILSRMLMKKSYKPHLLMMDKEQQLIAVNAMMRQMSVMNDSVNKLEGYRKVVDYLELEKFFEDEGISVCCGDHTRFNSGRSLYHLYCISIITKGNCRTNYRYIRA